MPWTGYPETMVTQLTYTEWVFSLRAQREVQIGYSIRVANAWELFGNDHWVWFTGAVASFRGAIQIVSQWAERENLGPRDRVWQWVHWKNPTNDDVVVKPYLLLAPPIGDRFLMQSTETTARRSVWTLVDVGAGITAAGTVLPDPGGDDSGRGGGGAGGGGGQGGRQGLQLAIMPRAVAGERIRKVALRGDLRYVPTGELWGRLDQLVRPRVRAEGPGARGSRSAKPGRSARARRRSAQRARPGGDR
jgi:hypothetical protein